MILHISDQLIKKRNKQENFNDFILNIMLAYKEGKHVIIISPISIRKLIFDKKIGEYTKQLLNSYNSHNKASLSLLQHFGVIIKIIPKNFKEKVYSKISTKVEIRQIHMDKFVDTVNIQSTILLGENTNDSKVYNLIAEYYRLKNNLNFLKVSCREQMGGGDTTAKQYKHIYNSGKEFCLCILDSDKKLPQNDYGETAKKVKSFHHSQINFNYKCQYFILNKLELENYIPEKFYIKNFECVETNRIKYNFQKINKLRDLNYNATNYLDFKKGLKSFKQEDNEAINKFWYNVLSKSKILWIPDDSNHYIKGYGDKILDGFIECEHSEIFEQVDNDSYIKREWLELGKSISSFIFGSIIRRAI
ncbi:MAG: hypothetical protein CMP77_14990 [Flavobacterium sp.]|nr:hypothetical protein [Flavobacterium sp.]|tara:strand:- start:42565 stop:43647 length:1083 start_codon:yes stop_codon:yes gene_type:complete